MPQRAPRSRGRLPAGVLGARCCRRTGIGWTWGQVRAVPGPERTAYLRRPRRPLPSPPAGRPAPRIFEVSLRLPPAPEVAA